MSTDDATAGESTPSDDEVVRTAAEAAEDVIFSRFKQSAVRDVDVTVTFEDGVLDVDVYLNVPEARNTEEKVAEDAALAARAAVDELFDEAED